MKFTLIGSSTLFCSRFSGWAGTFIRNNFNNGDLKDWQELWGDKGPAVWEIVDGRTSSRKVVNASYAFVLRLEIAHGSHYDYDELDVKPLKKHGIGGISIAGRVQRKLGITFIVVFLIP